ISASGEITLSADGNDKANPSGSLSGRRPMGRAPLPQALAGALIGRIGNGRPFPIGAGPATIAAPDSGRLSLGINDDNVSDNAGQFQIQLSGSGVGSQRGNRTRDDNNRDNTGSGNRRRRP
ncbi:MAG TPA: hypothetical protein VEL02_09300, partial [Jatrophihabitantaceae bacterium]|nr:hypothetical protein [Jatrophihabitantaceae bacterium]